MSVIRDAKSIGMDFHIEHYNTADEVVREAEKREITNAKFLNMKTYKYDKKFNSVSNYEEALALMEGGYQPTVDSMKGLFKAKIAGESKRFGFENAVAGYAPIVPLALKGVPNSMLAMKMKPIKAKVIDVYYDSTVAAGTSINSMIEAGKALLGAIVELEQQGYRFNLYAMQSYSDCSSADVLTVKIKDATQPLDLKRVSFTLTHPAFFRVIGFDWYSKLPNGKYRSGYGCGLGYNISDEQVQKMGKEIFGKNAVVFMAQRLLKKSKEAIKESIENVKFEN